MTTTWIATVPGVPAKESMTLTSATIASISIFSEKEQGIIKDMSLLTIKNGRNRPLAGGLRESQQVGITTGIISGISRQSRIRKVRKPDDG